MFQLPPGPSIALASAAAAQRSPRQLGSPEGLKRGPRLPRQLLHAPPVPAPGPAQRPCVSASSLWWRRIRRDLKIARQARQTWGWRWRGGVVGVTFDLGVDLQVTKLWEEELEASFCLFGWSVQYLPGSSITIVPLGFPGGRNTQPWAFSYSMVFSL